MSAENSEVKNAEDLLPLVYDELRNLAAQRLSHENPGQTLQTTALVYEAYLRLARSGNPGQWQNRRHFFAAAAEAMRRILIDNARRKKRQKRGDDFDRVDFQDADLAQTESIENLLSIDEALKQLEGESPDRAELVKLRYFAGMSLDEAAEVLGVSRTTAHRQWTFAHAWLYRKLATETSD